MKKKTANTEFKPLSGRDYPRFSHFKTFFRLPIHKMNSSFDVALFGIPFDGGASYRPGSRFAPAKIREASSLGRSYHWSRDISIFEKLRVADIGDCPVVPIDLPQTYQKIEAFVDQVISTGKKFISVGGDHSTTLPVLRSLKKHYGKVALIHFDAHLDTYPAAWGCEYHHGSFLRHAINEELVKPSQILQIGIRGPLAGKEDLEVITKNKINVQTIDDIRKGTIDEFINSLPAFNSLPTYISFDVDCLDPAYAPGTGTPVPGGMTSYEVQRILRGLKIKNLVGGDIVEVCPAYDPTEITSLMGVDVMFEMLSLMTR